MQPVMLCISWQCHSDLLNLGSAQIWHLLNSCVFSCDPDICWVLSQPSLQIQYLEQVTIMYWIPSWYPGCHAWHPPVGRFFTSDWTISWWRYLVQHPLIKSREHEQVNIFLKRIYSENAYICSIIQSGNTMVCCPSKNRDACFSLSWSKWLIFVLHNISLWVFSI